jgi:hypothetical protein
MGLELFADQRAFPPQRAIVAARFEVTLKDRSQPAEFYVHVKRNARFDDCAEVLKAAPECFRIENGTQTVGRKPSQLKRAAGQDASLAELLCK